MKDAAKLDEILKKLHTNKSLNFTDHSSTCENSTNEEKTKRYEIIFFHLCGTVFDFYSSNNIVKKKMNLYKCQSG